MPIGRHIDWTAACIAWLDAHGLNTIEATGKAESDWTAFVRWVASQTVFLSCDSWYLGANVPGKSRVFMPLLSGFRYYAERCATAARRASRRFRTWEA